MEQMLVIWATQSIQERKRSPVSHQRKSVPKHKMQHATVRRKAESKTIFQHVSPSAALPDITVPRKSHPGVRGSPGCSPAALYLPTPVLGSAGPEPRQRRALGPERGFPRRPGPGPLGWGPVGVGCGGRRGGPAKQYLLPPGNEPHGGLGERAAVAPGPGSWTENLKAGPLPPPSRPGPRVALQEGGPGITFWVSRGSGASRRAGPRSLLPHRLLPLP